MFFKLFLGETEEELRCICTLFVPESIERKKKVTLSQAPEGRIILVSAHTIESNKLAHGKQASFERIQ